MTISLKVEIIGGSDIEQAIKDARYLADRLGVLVIFNFNGVHMAVSSNSNLEDKHNEYKTELKAGTEKDF